MEKTVIHKQFMNKSLDHIIQVEIYEHVKIFQILPIPNFIRQYERLMIKLKNLRNTFKNIEFLKKLEILFKHFIMMFIKFKKPISIIKFLDINTILNKNDDYESNKIN